MADFEGAVIAERPRTSQRREGSFRTRVLAEKRKEAKAKLKKGGASAQIERCLIDQVDQCAQSTEVIYSQPAPWQTVGIGRYCPR